MVQAVYIGNYVPVCADIKAEPFSMITYDAEGNLKGIYDHTYTIPMYVDNGTTINLMPTHYYEKATFLHDLPKHDATGETIKTGNGTIPCHFWMDIAVYIQGCLLQLKVLVCNTQAQMGILISKMALEQMQTWQDYATNTLYVKQTAIPLFATHDSEILPGQKVIIKVTLDHSMKDIYDGSFIEGQGVAWIWSNDSSKPAQPIVAVFVKDKTLIIFQNMTESTQYIEKGACLGILDMQSKDGAMTNFNWEFPVDDEGNLVLYAHTFANSLDPTRLAKEDEQSKVNTCIAISQQPQNHEANQQTPDDEYPWLDKDDPRRSMTDEEIMRMKIPLQNSVLNEVEKDRLIQMVMKNREALSIHDEIGTCPYFEVKLQLRDDKPFFV